MDNKEKRTLSEEERSKTVIDARTWITLKTLCWVKEGRHRRLHIV